MANIKGIDISYANRNLDYNALKKKGVEFAIIRTGYRQHTDDMFHKHMKGCLSAGIKVGAYVYCKATDTDEAFNEAEYAVKLLNEYRENLTYPVFYDMEDNSIVGLGKTMLTNIATTFLGVVKNSGYKAGVYANPSWFENCLDKSKLIGKCEIWLAHWTQSPNTPTKYNYGQSIWQWGLDKELNLDGDISYRDYSEENNTSNVLPLYTIYQSIGVARMRTQPNLKGEEKRKCERGGLYVATAFSTDDEGRVWFQHADNGLWSSLTDYDNTPLFTAQGKATPHIVLYAVNVRSNAGINGKKVAHLLVGDEAYFTGNTERANGLEWGEIIYNGKKAWTITQAYSKS